MAATRGATAALVTPGVAGSTGAPDATLGTDAMMGADAVGETAVVDVAVEPADPVARRFPW